MTATRMLLKVCAATVRAGMSTRRTEGSVGLRTSAARENLDAGKKNAILYEEDEDASLPGDMSTGAVMEMGAACSFWGFAVTPMNLAGRMKEPPWSPSNMPR